MKKTYAIVVIMFFIFFSSFMYGDVCEAGQKFQSYEVHLVREYLDGEQSIEVVTETAQSVPALLQGYKNWQLVEHDKRYVKLYKKVQDISPLLKSNGYFGLSENGILTIFDGKPSDENVIQSFYQLDVDKLESHLIDSLKHGIPIKTKQDYVYVLANLKRYEK